MSKYKHYGQSKWESLIEQFLNIGSGFIISMLVWMFVIVPLWNIDAGPTDHFAITAIFTVVSITRGFLWRRAFNWWKLRQIEQWHDRNDEHQTAAEGLAEAER